MFSRGSLQRPLASRQAAAGGIGAVIMNGAKRGLFSNEAGSGSAPCAAAAADISHPAKEGLLQATGGIYRHAGDLQLYGYDHAAD